MIFRTLVPHVPGVQHGIVQIEDHLYATSKCCGERLVRDPDAATAEERRMLYCFSCDSSMEALEPVGFPFPEKVRPGLRVTEKRLILADSETLDWWVSVWVGFDVEVEVTR